MEHSVDLAAKTFVQVISPSSARKVLKKIKRAFRATSVDDSNTFDIDELDVRLADFDFDGEEEEVNEDVDAVTLEEDFDAGDTIGKALTLVKQVIFSRFSCSCD